MALVAAVLVGLSVLAWSCGSAGVRHPLGRLARAAGHGARGRVHRVEEAVGAAVLGLLGLIPGNGGRMPLPAATGGDEGGRRRRAGLAVLSAAAGGFAVLVGGWLAGCSPATGLLVAATVGGGLLPGWYRAREVRRRARELTRSLPQFLDFVEVCLRAGLNLRGSLERAAHGVGGRLGAEVRLLLDACPPAQVLSDLGERYAAPDLKAVGGALRQGELLGTPLADVLRAQAEGVREAGRRRMRAAAATAPLKLSLCTVCFFLPSVLALVLVPHLLAFLGRW